MALASSGGIMPGASTREIAKVAGVSKSTVANERGVQKWTPDEPPVEPARVIGIDGKSYPGRVVWGSRTPQHRGDGRHRGVMRGGVGLGGWRGLLRGSGRGFGGARRPQAV
jgi:hypothetical protein